MIQCVFEDEESLDIFAEEQCWDEETLEQLKNEYSIYFMTDGGDAAMPVLVRDGSVIIGERTMVISFSINNTVSFLFVPVSPLFLY